MHGVNSQQVTILLLINYIKDITRLMTERTINAHKKENDCK